MTLAPCLSRMLLCLWCHHTIRCHPWQSSTSGCEDKLQLHHTVCTSQFSVFQDGSLVSTHCFANVWCLLFATHALKGMLKTWKTCIVHVSVSFSVKHTLLYVSDFCIMFSDFLSLPYLQNGMCYSHCRCVFSSHLQKQQWLYLWILPIWLKTSMYILNLDRTMFQSSFNQNFYFIQLPLWCLFFWGKDFFKQKYWLQMSVRVQRV